MAQQVEHVLGKDEVTGSNPVISSILSVFLIKLSGFMAKTLFFAFSGIRPGIGDPGGEERSGGQTPFRGTRP